MSSVHVHHSGPHFSITPISKAVLILTSFVESIGRLAWYQAAFPPSSSR